MKVQHIVSEEPTRKKRMHEALQKAEKQKKIFIGFLLIVRKREEKRKRA
jgi:hypothetical protein